MVKKSKALIPGWFKISLGILAGLALVIYFTHREILPPVSEQPREAPLFALSTLEGQIVRLQDFRGQTVLVNFWATSCGPCQAEFPSFFEFLAREKGLPITILAVSIDESLDEIGKFLKTFPITDSRFVVVRDTQRAVAERYGTFKIPETYILDKELRIIRKVVNAQDWMEPKILSFFDSLISEPANLSKSVK